MIRDHLILKIHKERLDMFLGVLEKSNSFSQAVKTLSHDVIQLQPKLHSILQIPNSSNHNGDPDVIKKRMQKKTVIPLVPF